MPPRTPTLTLRELNRALLARQMLLKRARIGAVDAVERLAYLQGQWAPSPYVTRWARMGVSGRDWPARQIGHSELVKATLMRASQNIVDAHIMPAHSEYRQLARHVAPPAKLRKYPKPDLAYDLVVRRHLGAFGPATIADIATWSSVRVPHIRAALARIKDVREFTDDRGRELFDLARAPRPVADTDAPARFLARFDAAILGHAAPERVRILPEPYRKQVIFSAEVWPTFLVDGFVAGRWTIAVRPKETILELKPCGKLSRTDRNAPFEEGEQLWSAIERHRVIRARLMRGTLHLVSAHDFFPYAVATQDLQRGAWNRLQIAKGVEPEKVAALAVHFARTPRAKEEVIAHLRDR